jgi:hypothetical protein
LLGVPPGAREHRRPPRRRAIGIEIASEDWLEERDGELLAFGRPFGGAVYDHCAPWREQRFFAAYTPEQVGVRRASRGTGWWRGAAGGGVAAWHGEVKSSLTYS